MAYFLILPGVIMWLIFIAVAVTVTRFVPTLNGTYPYVWRSGIGSVVGIIAANLALIAVLAFGFMVLRKIDEEHDVIHDIAGLILGLGATIGPLIASLIGWLIGGVIGFLIASRSRRMIPGLQLKSDAAP